MPASEKHAISLPSEDADVERWLREEVGPVYDAMQADPGRGVPAERVEAELRELHYKHQNAGTE